MKWLWSYALLVGFAWANFSGAILPLLASLTLFLLGLLFVFGPVTMAIIGGYFVWLGVHDWHGYELLWRTFVFPTLLIGRFLSLMLAPTTEWRANAPPLVDWDAWREWWWPTDDPIDEPPPRHRDPPREPPPRHRDPPREPPPPLLPELQAAYALLEMPPDAPSSAITLAYRRQIARYHPDRLTAVAASEAQIAAATAQTVALIQAYTLICRSRIPPP